MEVGVKKIESVESDFGWAVIAAGALVVALVFLAAGGC